MAKVNLEIIGKDNGATAAVQGLTGSIVKAQIAFEAIKMVLSSVVDFGKKAIESYKEQETALAGLKSIVGENTDAYTDFADQIQNTTTIGDEQVLSMQKLGLTMGVSSDKINEATKGAIGLSSAFGIDLNTAMKMAAQANQGQYNMLSRYIPELKNANSTAEKAAIVQEKMAQGFKIAEDRANTFTGKLEQYNNISGEISESFGAIIAAVGKDFVQSMIDGAKSINEFIKSSQTLETIGNIFGTISATIKTIQEALKPLGPVFNDAFKTVGDAVGKLMKLFSEGKNGAVIFTVLKGVVMALGIAITILANAISIVITAFVNMVNTVKLVGNVIRDVFSGDFKKASESVKSVGDNIIKTYSDIATGVGEMTKDIKKQFDNLGKSIDEKQLADTFEKTLKNTRDKVVNAFESTGKDAGQKFVENISDSMDKSLEKTKETMEQLIGSSQMLFGGLQGISNQYYANELTQAEGNAEKTKEIKRKQFQTNKEMATINSIISTAEAVMKASTAAPFPWNIPLMIAMGAIGAVQTGLIASQPMPAFANGGISSGGLALVGERGPEIVNLPRGAEVNTAEKSKTMMGNSITIGSIVANDPIEFFRKLSIQIKRSEMARGQA